MFPIVVPRRTTARQAIQRWAWASVPTGMLATLLAPGICSAAVGEPIFRGGFTQSSFSQFYRGMSNASQWFTVESAEVMLGLGSALVALVGLLLLSIERRRGAVETPLEPTASATAIIPDVEDPLEARRIRRAEARRRRNARAAAETSSRLGR